MNTKITLIGSCKWFKLKGYLLIKDSLEIKKFKITSNYVKKNYLFK